MRRSRRTTSNPEVGSTLFNSDSDLRSPPSPDSASTRASSFEPFDPRRLRGRLFVDWLSIRHSFVKRSRTRVARRRDEKEHDNIGAVRVHEFISFDGVIDTPTWTMGYGFDAKMCDAIAACMASCDALLLGRTTFEMFEPAWSSRAVDEDPGAAVALSEQARNSPRVLDTDALAEANNTWWSCSAWEILRRRY